jgi:enoyl-CoA hydratase
MSNSATGTTASAASAVRVEKSGPVTTVILHRPDVRNAVDPATARLLLKAFEEFDADPEAHVAVLYGDGGTFCAGFDLKALSSGAVPDGMAAYGNGPMGPTRLRVAKPVIAAVAGHAVAGGLELALWCDLRVAEASAVFGVFCRRWGVPLVDGGTVRLPRLIGESRAMDMVLTGRAVGADEALAMGLANRVVPDGQARAAAEALAAEIAALPQLCLREDRISVLEQHGLDEEAALRNELKHGQISVRESAAGAQRFAGGAGRHGTSASASADGG